MKYLKIVLMCFFFLTALSEVCLAEGKVTEILKEMEKRQELGVDVTLRIKLTTQQVRQGTRQQEFIAGILMTLICLWVFLRKIIRG